MIDISRIASEQLVEQAQRAKRVDAEKFQHVGRTAWAKEDDAKPWEGGKPAVSCIEFDHKTFVGLATEEAVLAVYRVAQNGGLRRLRCLPMPVCAAIALNTGGNPNFSPEDEETDQ